VTAIAADPVEWVSCKQCRSLVYDKRLSRNLRVCPDCGHHNRVDAHQRLAQLLDPGSVELLDLPVREADPLGFVDSKPYPTRLASARASTGLDEAVVCVAGRIEGNPLVVAVMDFGFMGGSLSGAVGELITLAGETALDRGVPLLIVTASGGARMQEGAVALMQMAKTSQMLGQLDEASLLTISLVTDPTFGGVAASFATLCDVIIAEPGARLGFAGRRVIEQTIKQTLPPDFQTAEFLLANGLIDLIRPRQELRPTLTRLLSIGSPPRSGLGLRPPISIVPSSTDKNGTVIHRQAATEEPDPGQARPDEQTATGTRTETGDPRQARSNEQTATGTRTETGNLGQAEPNEQTTTSTRTETSDPGHTGPGEQTTTSTRTKADDPRQARPNQQTTTGTRTEASDLRQARSNEQTTTGTRTEASDPRRGRSGEHAVPDEQAVAAAGTRTETGDPWQVVQRARDLGRPTALDYFGLLLDDFEELRGDRLGAEDPAIVGGLGRLAGVPVVVVGHQKGHTAAELSARNFGMPTPAGYRKAARLMNLAAKLGIPVVSLIDTPGAYPGKEAEQHGQAIAIAENIRLMSRLPVPVVSVVTGEGGSGGALALGVANHVLICANSVYSVISPEGCAAILWNDPAAAPRAAEALRMTATELEPLGIVDRIVPEPAGGTQADHVVAGQNLRAAVLTSLRELLRLDAGQLVADRRARFRAFGA
jgi:acetyl-CoA carboxylase carboxyl transferase beta subunit/acetyl-CoA carboxylase carboxyl transferase alpha subunit